MESRAIDDITPKELVRDPKNTKEAAKAIVIEGTNKAAIAYSWKAVTDLLDGDQTNESLFFRSGESKGVDLKKQKAVIAFVHGIHALATAAKIEGVPSLQTSIQERYRWVLQFLKETPKTGDIKAHTDGILNDIQKQYLRTPARDIIDMDKMIGILKTPKDALESGWLREAGSVEQPNNVASVNSKATREDVPPTFSFFDNLPSLYDILDVD